MAEKKTFPTYRHEAKLTDFDGFRYVVGVDEAGRGPGAGPVVAAAVHIPAGKVRSLTGRLDDSKKMTAKQRDRLYVTLVTSYRYGVGIVENETIDRINILEATKLAMAKAIAEIPEADYALIDGNMRLPDLAIPYESIVGGDGRSISIAAGSVIAKVTRDRIMDRLHEEYPLYGWNTNRGYLSQKHIAAIREHGTTPYHRLSFNKVGR